MPFIVLLVEKSDFSEVARIDEAAMKDNGITQAIAGALAAEGRSRTDFFLDYIGGSYEHDKDTFWKVVDTDTGTMISVAKYSSHPTVTGKDSSLKEERQSVDRMQGSPGTNREAEAQVKQPPSAKLIETMTKLWSDWQQFSREHVEGIPHANLQYIATHPDHQRRGAATLLLRKGAAKADEAGLDTFLQASAEGLTAYTRAGYHVVRTDSIDLAEFGVDKVEVRHCMRRPFSKIN